MRFSILADFDHESAIDKVMDRFHEVGVRKFFQEKNYGGTLMGITIVLMCRRPALKFKQRIRYSRKEEKIYLDLMLDYTEFISVSQEQRDKITARKIIDEVPSIIRKYKLPDFNYEEFESDLGMLMSKILY